MLHRKATYSLIIPSARRFLSDVRHFVEVHAKQSGFTKEVIEHLKLAADEACSNIILHAYQGNNNGTIEVIISIEKKKFIMVMRDQGITFDKKTYQRPTDLRNSLNARQGGGWGIYLMEKLMDKVLYKKKGNVNEIHLIKYR